MSAIDWREIDFPNPHPDAEVQRAFAIAGDGFGVHVLYGREPFKGRSIGTHISITCVRHGKPVRVHSPMVAMVAEVLEQNGLRFPAKYDRNYFQAGDHKGLGLHIWEAFNA